MISVLLRSLNIILISLLAGSVICIFLGFHPEEYTWGTYLQVQKGLIKSFNSLLPILGFVCILVTLYSAYIHREQKIVMICLLIAGVCLIATGLVTRFGNQPINNIIMTWQADRISTDWKVLRDKWWIYHKIRTIFSTIALITIAFASAKMK